MSCFRKRNLSNNYVVFSYVSPCFRDESRQFLCMAHLIVIDGFVAVGIESPLQEGWFPKLFLFSQLD